MCWVIFLSHIRRQRSWHNFYILSIFMHYYSLHKHLCYNNQIKSNHKHIHGKTCSAVLWCTYTKKDVFVKLIVLTWLQCILLYFTSLFRVRGLPCVMKMISLEGFTRFVEVHFIAAEAWVHLPDEMEVTNAVHHASCCIRLSFLACRHTNDTSLKTIQTLKNSDICSFGSKICII